MVVIVLPVSQRPTRVIVIQKIPTKHRPMNCMIVVLHTLVAHYNRGPPRVSHSLLLLFGGGLGRRLLVLQLLVLGALLGLGS